MSRLKEFGDTAEALSKNPLGIIALFIVLIYGFAALVVGFSSKLSTAERHLIVWFLVIFPVVVLGVFTWLVSKHHEKLYAPSDYRDDAAFLKALPLNVQRQRLKDEVEEIKEEELSEAGSEQASAAITSEAVSDLPSKVFLSEELAIRAIEREFGVSIKRQAGMRHFAMDGLFIKDNQGFGVEVKYIRGGKFNASAIFGKVVSIANKIQVLGYKKFNIILALVAEDSNNAQFKESFSNLEKFMDSQNVTAQIRVFEFQWLREEFGI